MSMISLFPQQPNALVSTATSIYGVHKATYHLKSALLVVLTALHLIVFTSHEPRTSTPSARHRYRIPVPSFAQASPLWISHHRGQMPPGGCVRKPSHNDKKLRDMIAQTHTEVITVHQLYPPGKHSSNPAGVTLILSGSLSVS